MKPILHQNLPEAKKKTRLYIFPFIMLQARLAAFLRELRGGKIYGKIKIYTRSIEFQWYLHQKTSTFSHINFFFETNLKTPSFL
jgi:hypothetical protein